MAHNERILIIRTIEAVAACALADKLATEGKTEQVETAIAFASFQIRRFKTVALMNAGVE
jgi:hypothetical protein